MKVISYNTISIESQAEAGHPWTPGDSCLLCMPSNSQSHVLCGEEGTKEALRKSWTSTSDAGANYFLRLL